MKKTLLIIATIITVILTAGSTESVKPPEATTLQRPMIEVVFVLDTTGSMSGLINAAKQKIWSIANTLVGHLVRTPDTIHPTGAICRTSGSKLAVGVFSLGTQSGQGV